MVATAPTVRPDARLELVAAAELLFAEQGIDTPSLREITRQAGQRNTGALQYHFADRDGLLDAVVAKHEPGIDAERSVLLDRVEQAGGGGLRDLAETLVLPYARKLDDGVAGPAYLQVIAEIVSRPRRFADQFARVGAQPSMRRWAAAVEPHLPPLAVGRPLHRRFAAIRFMHTELAIRVRERRRRDARLFTSHLVDLAAAMLAAPVTEATSRLIEVDR